MFALHETTQRRVCRVTFVALCVVPTLLTLVAVAWCNRPWRQRDWERTLASTLHFRAELEDVERPTPGATTLTNLRLSELHTHSALGSVDHLTIRRDNKRLVLEAGKLELQSDELSSLLTAFKTWLSTESPDAFAFHAEQLTVVSPQWPALQLANLSISSEASGQKFRITAENLSGELLKAEIKAEQDVVRGILDAQTASLPAWLVGELVPGLGGCGPASFTGVIEVENSNYDQRGKLTGVLSNVDTRNWVGTASHQLQGRAQVDLYQVDWHNGVLEWARGSMKIDRGAATYSLLIAMKETMSCVPGHALKQSAPDELIPFQKLAVTFQLSRRGLALAGNEEGQMVVSVDGPLLFGPQTNTLIRMAQIVQLFHQRTPQGWLPATRAAHEMAEKLPLPDEKAEDTERR